MGIRIETKQFVICDYCGVEESVWSGLNFYEDSSLAISGFLPENWTHTMFSTQDGKWERKMFRVWCSFGHREKWMEEGQDSKEVGDWVVRV